MLVDIIIEDNYNISKMEVLTNHKLKRTLKQQYPNANIMYGYDYNPDYKDCLIATNECYNEDGDLLFDINSYPNGVHPDLALLLEEAGWHCEWIDNETIGIYEN